MKKLSLFAALVLLAVSASPLFAQDGGVDGPCVTSPENPTALLALVGSAGAVAASLRGRFRIRK